MENYLTFSEDHSRIDHKTDLIGVNKIKEKSEANIDWKLPASLKVIKPFFGVVQSIFKVLMKSLEKTYGDEYGLKKKTD